MSTPPEPEIHYSQPPELSFWTRLKTRRFLFISILVHVVVAIIATVFVVQTIAAKRKLTFTSAPPSPNPSTRALEHQVQMAKKQQTMSAPAAAKRITTTALSKIALPDMPTVPSMSESTTPGRMGMAGAMGLGTSLGGMGGGGGGGGLTAFGFRNPREGMLAGRFYDLKQTKDGKPTAIAKGGERAYTELLRSYVRNGWNESVFDNYYRAPNLLYTPQVYVPIGESEEAPKAFGVEKQVQPNLWVVHYKGRVMVSKSGRFRFIGVGDNVLVVRLDGQNVFDGSCLLTGIAGEKWEPSNLIDPAAMTEHSLGLANVNGWQLRAGKWMDLHGGSRLDIEVIIGDCGGWFSDYLMIEEQGATYGQRKDAPGKAYPIFQTVKSPVPQGSRFGGNGYNPEVAPEPMVFQGVAGNGFSTFP